MNRRVIEENTAFVREQLTHFYGGPAAYQEVAGRVNSHLQNLVNLARIVRYDDMRDAEKILESGRFKPIIERDADRLQQGREYVIGEDYNEKRRFAERTLFGIEDSAVVGRPVYGSAFNATDPTASRYGEVTFIFRDVVRPITTLTAGDSLNLASRMFPDGDTAKALIVAMPVQSVAIEILAPYLALSRVATNRLILAESLDDLRDLLNLPYFETQIHGDIGMEYVESIQIKPGTITTERFRQWAQSHQIPLSPSRRGR